MFNRVRAWLTAEWNFTHPPSGRDERTRSSSPNVFNATSIPGFLPKVPLQLNTVDCGLYTILFLAKWAEEAPSLSEQDWSVSDNVEWMLNRKDWFGSKDVSAVRRTLALEIRSIGTGKMLANPFFRKKDQKVKKKSK